MERVFFNLKKSFTLENYNHTVTTCINFTCRSFNYFYQEKLGSCVRKTENQHTGGVSEKLKQSLNIFNTESFISYLDWIILSTNLMLDVFFWKISIILLPDLGSVFFNTACRLLKSWVFQYDWLLSGKDCVSSVLWQSKCFFGIIIIFSLTV